MKIEIKDILLIGAGAIFGLSLIMNLYLLAFIRETFSMLDSGFSHVKRDKQNE